ncbi:MAG: dethiobiotin synthase [Arcobacteraceae bacterium]
MKTTNSLKNKQIVFVTGTNTNVGKSYACGKFLEKYSQEGFKVGYFKPIETGVITTPEDGSLLLNLTKKLNSDFNVTLDDVVPYQFELPASPFVAKKDTEIDIGFIKEKMNYLLQFCDVLIIEGAGGLMVPIYKDYFMIDLIKELNAKAILIAPSHLGSINQTLLSINALKNHDIEFDWYINLQKEKETFKEITLPFYESYFKEIKYLF